MHSALGATVGWLPIAVTIVVAAVGAGFLVTGPLGTGVWPARLVAAAAYAWNPFVYDRIFVGQVSVLAGYALLTWVLSFPIWRSDPALFPAVPFAFALHHATYFIGLTVGIFRGALSGAAR